MEQIILPECSICYFQYSNFWRAEGDGNCCLWQGTGTQWKEGVLEHAWLLHGPDKRHGEGGEKITLCLAV